MSARGIATVLAALAATVLLLFGPGYLAKQEVTEDPSGKVIAQGFKLLEATTPGLKLDKKNSRRGGIPRSGGGRAVFECAKGTVNGQPSGWFCIGLTPDGRAGAALWAAPKPNTENAQFFIGDVQTMTRPPE